MKRVAAAPVIDLGILFGKDQVMPYPLNNNSRAIVYAYARVALLEGLKLLGIRSGDNVLIPSFICNVMLAPFNYLGVKVKYYPVNPDFSIDKNTIVRQIDESTKAIMAVNYFGFSADHKTMRDICGQYGIFYIEDNAHGFLSKDGDRELGGFGDISIFSLRKTLPIPNGAILLVNNPALNLKGVQRYVKHELGLMFYLWQINKTIENLSGVNLFKLLKTMQGRKADYFPKDESCDEETNIRRYFVGSSKMMDLVVRKTNAAQIVKVRRGNFKYWLNNLKVGAPIFKVLPEGVVPYVFPVLVSNREQFLAQMYDKGFECFPWPTLPSGEYERLDFYNKVVAIPLWK